VLAGAEPLQQCRDALPEGFHPLSLLDPLLREVAHRVYHPRSDVSVTLSKRLLSVTFVGAWNSRLQRGPVHIGVLSVDWLYTRYRPIWLKAPCPQILVHSLVAAAICYGTWTEAYRFIKAAIDEMTAAGACIAAAVNDENNNPTWVSGDPTIPTTCTFGQPALIGRPISWATYVTLYRLWREWCRTNKPVKTKFARQASDNRLPTCPAWLAGMNPPDIVKKLNRALRVLRACVRRG
jgi:hypothetical protein